MSSSLPPLCLYNHRQHCFCPVHSTATHVCTITASMMSSSLPPLCLSCLYNHATVRKGKNVSLIRPICNQSSFQHFQQISNRLLRVAVVCKKCIRGLSSVTITGFHYKFNVKFETIPELWSTFWWRRSSSGKRKSHGPARLASRAHARWRNNKIFITA